MTAIHARLTNLAGYRRSTWVDVGTPYGDLKDPEMDFVTEDGLRLRAVRGGDRGKHTTFYRVRTPFAGLQSLTGTFQPRTDPIVDIPFQMTDWVTDDIRALIPTWVVKIDGTYYRMTNPEIKLVEKSAAHQRWHLKGRLAGGARGFVGQVWLTFKHLEDVADFHASLTWSDRQDPALGIAVEGVGIEVGEPVQLDFGPRNGHTGPSKTQENKWVWLLAAPVGFDDGSAFPISGRMLCTPSGDMPKPQTPEEVEILEERVASLQAALEAPARGMAIDCWDGKWLAHKWVPRNRAGSWADADDDYRRFEDWVTNPAPLQRGEPRSQMYAPRQIGSAYNPGRTGDQEDFGSTKGSMAVSLGDPRWLWKAEHANQGVAFRGFTHFNQDASILRHEDYPDWLTWSGRTHFRVNPNTLGKQDPVWGDFRRTGWDGWDDQHRSWHNWMAYLALSDDPMMLDLLIHHIRTDQSQTPNRMGNARAVGRLLLAWASASLLLPDEWSKIVKKISLAKIAAVKATWRGGKHNNPVRVTGAKTDARMRVTDGNGNPVPAWTVWTEALMCNGLYAAWKQWGDEDFREVLMAVSRTIVEYGTYQNSGGWATCDNVWYPNMNTPDEGKPINPALYTNTSTFINGPGSISSWVVPAILIFIEIYPHEDAVKQRARAIANHFTGGQEATDWRKAEWWACVERI